MVHESTGVLWIDFHGKLVLSLFLRENGNCIFGSSLLLLLLLKLHIFLSSPSLPGVTVETAKQFKVTFQVIEKVALQISYLTFTSYFTNYWTNVEYDPPHHGPGPCSVHETWCRSVEKDVRIVVVFAGRIEFVDSRFWKALFVIFLNDLIAGIIILI